MRRTILLQQTVLFGLLCAISLIAQTSRAHEGPDPIAHWSFTSRAVSDGKVAARIGPDAKLSGRARVVVDELGESLHFSGWKSTALIAEDLNEVRKMLPQQAITISAWVTVEKRQAWGGIIGTVQDNGNSESGWVLGYDNDNFYVGLASTGADDGDGMMTYLKGETAYELARWYHVVAVYDGAKLRLFVNGRLDGESDQQSGGILYPEAAPFVIGAYRDDNENNLHQGRIREVSIYDLAAKEAWVSQQFEHQQRLTSVVAIQKTSQQQFVVKPYLQFGTQTSMTVMWQTSQPGSSVLHYGETADCSQMIEIDEAKSIHTVKLTDLKPETQYFYRAETLGADGSGTFSDGYTFCTAVHEQTPFAFAVISDTQGNPKVSGQISKLAWAQRPSFALHAGDLVDTGTVDSHWTQHFFPGMEELICRVPFYPVLGNHEQNAKNYFDYMSLPDPEYYYQFQYGNAHFFMIDSNRNVDPGSEQYRWLDEQLAASDSTWKFVCHHHPLYSSDENDYGDLWQTNQSSRGDLRVRQLASLYEKHNVDLVWNGHIHSYERTWPVREGKAQEDGAPIYIIAGGGGGGLETPGPVRPFFQNNVRRDHHYVMVHVNGRTLEFRAYTLDDRLFDTFRLEKKSQQ